MLTAAHILSCADRTSLKPSPADPSCDLPSSLAELRREWPFALSTSFETKWQASELYAQQQTVTDSATTRLGLAQLASDALDALETNDAENQFLWELSSHLFWNAIDDKDWSLAIEILARIDPLPYSYSNFERSLIYPEMNDGDLIECIDVLLSAFERARGASQQASIGDTIVRAFGPLADETDPVKVAQQMRTLLQQPPGTLQPNADYPWDRPWEWGDLSQSHVPLVMLRQE